MGKTKKSNIPQSSWCLSPSLPYCFLQILLACILLLESAGAPKLLKCQVSHLIGQCLQLVVPNGVPEANCSEMTHYKKHGQHHKTNQWITCCYYNAGPQIECLKTIEIYSVPVLAATSYNSRCWQGHGFPRGSGENPSLLLPCL